MRLYFLRHAESLKSVEDRHGGPGMPLTPQGRLDADEVALFLSSVERLDPTATDFVCSSLVQVRETAQIIDRAIGATFRETSAIRNIGLGVLDGLTKEEGLRLHPECARQLEEWRNRQRAIDDVHIPGAETMDQFYERIYGFIAACRRSGRDVLLIGTRSVGVAVRNILETDSAKIVNESYERYLYDPCSVSKFCCQIDSVSVGYTNNTSFLTVKPQNPDV